SLCAEGGTPHRVPPLDAPSAGHFGWRLLPGSLLLLGKDRAEHGLLDVRLECAPFGFDEGVPAAALRPRELLLHVVLSAVIAERHVARQGAHERERAVELVNDSGRQHARRAQAAAEHQVEGTAALLCLHRPGCAAVGVTWCQMCDEGRA